MAKTFNPNRVGGGQVSIVRDAQGNYSLKETGFDQISSLNMIDLGAVATTTTAAKTQTAADKTGTTTTDQTKAAFLLPKQGKDDEPFTTEKMLTSAKDLSSSLQDVSTPTTIQDSMPRTNTSTFDARQEDSLENRTSIKSPTEKVFGNVVPLEDDFKTMVGPKVETPQEKLKVTSANVQKGLVEPPGFTNPLKGLLGPKFQTEKGSEVTQAGKPGMLGDTGGSMDRMGSTMPGNLGDTGRSMNQMSGAMPGMLDQTGQMGASNTLGISADPSRFAGSTKGTLSDPLEKKDFISIPAKKTFATSVSTALKGIGDTAMKVAAMSPTLALVRELGKQRNESAGAIALNKSKFNIVTSPGSMQGRIVGDDGSYDPANNLFHGMNRDSAFGNLTNAGQKRIDTINKTLERQAKKGKQSQTLIDRKEKFERELEQHKQDLREAPVTGTTKPGQGGGSESKGSSKIVCTMMNESYGFGSFRNKIWLRHSKNLAPEYQIGYHRLFLPLVKKAKTNKILKKILEHIAIHRTIDIRQQERNKIHLIGRIYRTILEPICYWAGKK